jgi:hypothetical protein
MRHHLRQRIPTNFGGWGQSDTISNTMPDLFVAFKSTQPEFAESEVCFFVFFYFARIRFSFNVSFNVSASLGGSWVKPFSPNGTETLDKTLCFIGQELMTI